MIDGERDVVARRGRLGRRETVDRHPAQPPPSGERDAEEGDRGGHEEQDNCGGAGQASDGEPDTRRSSEGECAGGERIGTNSAIRRRILVVCDVDECSVNCDLANGRCLVL